MNWLRLNWAIVSFVLTVTVAFGQQQIRVEKAEEKIADMQAENKEQLMRDILQGQRSIERKVSK